MNMNYEMNAKATNNSNKAPGRKGFRRTIAIVCAVTIALLQCAVVLTVDPVHGATDVTLSLKYSGLNKPAERTVSVTGGSAEWEIQVAGEPAEGEESAKVILKGKTYKDIFSDYKAPSNDAPSDRFIVTDVTISGTPDPAIDTDFLNSLMGLTCTRTETSLNDLLDVRTIEASTSAKPVSRCNVSVNPTSAEKGKSVKVNYELVIDSFIKNCDNYKSIKNGFTTINWTVSNGAIFGNGKNTLTTTAESNSLTVTIKKTGNTVVSGRSNFATIESKTINGKEARKDIKDATITGITDKEYNGKEQTQEQLKVVLGGVELKEGTDFKVSYRNRTNVGTCTMTFEGIGNYCGSTTRTFEIKEEAKELDPGDVKIRSTGTIKRSDSDREVKSKLKVYVKGTKIDSDDWELLEYDHSRDEASIKVKGYGNNITKKVSSGSTYSYSYNYNRNTYRYSPTRSTLNRPTSVTGSTLSTAPTVVYEPDRTITVKEVTLGEKIEDEPQQTDPYETTMDPTTDDTANNDFTEVEEPKLDFGPTVGSAAVAAAAAGAGVVGRIRRFRLDTATEAVEQVTNSGE